MDSYSGLAAWTDGAQNAHGETFALTAGYVELLTPYAFADRHEGRYVVGMHSALLVTIMEFALFVFTQADQFPEVGNAAGETSPSWPRGELPGLHLLKLTLDQGTVVAERDRWRVPRDADRHVMAVYLAMLMSRFVWFHELAHCYNGHIDLLRAQGWQREWRETEPLVGLVGFQTDSADLSPAAWRHHLELDADRTALHGCCQVQILGGENLPGIAALDVALRLRLTIFAAYAMTWLFDSYQTYMDARDNPTHPQPASRLAHLVQMTRQEISAGIDGFDAFHDDLCAQFDRLAAVMPGLHRIADLPQPVADTNGAQRLETLLAPHRFNAPA